MYNSRALTRRPAVLIPAVLIPAAFIIFLALPAIYKAHAYKYYLQVTQRSYNKFATAYLQRPIPVSYVSDTNIKHKLAHKAGWAIQQIDNDFANYSDFSKQAVENTFAVMPSQKLLINFVIKDGKLTVKQKDAEMNGACKRGLEIYTNIFDYIAKEGYVKDVSFLVRLSDYFSDLTDLENVNFAPIMTTARDPNSKMDKNLVLIPDYMSLEDIPKFAPRIAYANKLYHWNNKEHKIIWRGGHADVSGFRQKVVEYSAAHPESMVDAKWADDKKSPDFLLPEDQVKYKFLLNIDGHGPAWTRPIWQLLSNSVMVKQQSDLTQWYYQALQPDVHYISVSLDPAELEPTINKYTDSQLRAIGRNGRDFAKNNLLIDDMFVYLIMALQKYEALQAAS